MRSSNPVTIAPSNVDPRNKFDFIFGSQWENPCMQTPQNFAVVENYKGIECGVQGPRKPCEHKLVRDNSNSRHHNFLIPSKFCGWPKNTNYHSEKISLDDLRSISFLRALPSPPLASTHGSHLVGYKGLTVASRMRLPVLLSNPAEQQICTSCCWSVHPPPCLRKITFVAKKNPEDNVIIKPDVFWHVACFVRLRGMLQPIPK